MGSLVPARPTARRGTDLVRHEAPQRPDDVASTPVGPATSIGRTLVDLARGAHLDLGWAEYRAGAEYDGRVHREARQHSCDLDRHNGIRLARWTALQVDKRLLSRPDALLARLALLGPRS